jgi:hypothetical protein
MRVRPTVLVCFSLLAAAAGTACGGDDDGVTEPPPPTSPSSPVTSITVIGPGGERVPGEEVQFAAVLRDGYGADQSGRPVTWSSTNLRVARVSGTGLVTAVGPGTARIVAGSEGQLGRRDIVVVEGGLVGPDGGTVTAFGGEIRLEVPAGAVTAPLGIRVVRQEQLPLDPSLVEGIGFALEPEATAFAVPATITLQYDPEAAPSGVPESDLRVHRVAAGGIQTVGGQVDPEADEASAAVSGLGSFAVARGPSETPCTDPVYRQFDFWLGAWSVTSPNQPPGSAPTPSDITVEPGGCAVFESWALGSGRSLNVYNPADGQWHQTYVFSTGQRVALIGGLQGESMVLIGPSAGPPGSFQRWTWSRLSEGRVRQLQEFSSDGGATLTTGFDGTYVPR